MGFNYFLKKQSEQPMAIRFYKFKCGLEPQGDLTLL